MGQIALLINELLGSVENTVQILPNIDLVRGMDIKLLFINLNVLKKRSCLLSLL